MEMNFSQELLKELSLEMRQIILHFGRAALKQRGYMVAAIREKMPRSKELCDALEHLDRAGVLDTMAQVPKNDPAQQTAALEQVRQTLVEQKLYSPEIDRLLESIGKALQWQGTAWQDCLQKPFVPVQPEPDSDVNKLSERTWKVGDELQFGCYYQESSEKMDPITWCVLGDYDDNMIWLMSKDILDAKPYCDDPAISSERICWANSSLRQWLNTSFLQTAFNEAEQKVLAKATNLGMDLEISETGPNTEDLVSILDDSDLSILEEYGSLIKRLLPAKVTPYAYSQGAYRDQKTETGIWRLCSLGGWREDRRDDLWREKHPLQCRKLTTTVDCSGVRDGYGDSVFANYVGIRPVIVLSTVKGTEPAEETEAETAGTQA